MALKLKSSSTRLQTSLAEGFSLSSNWSQLWAHAPHSVRHDMRLADW